MSYHAYLLIHLIAIFMVLTSLGAMALHMVSGGSKASFGARKLAAAVHGTGLLVALIAGFGLLARLGVAHGAPPAWAAGKLVIWLILGALPVLVYRMPKAATALFFSIFVFGGLAAYLAIFKPGAEMPTTSTEVSAPAASAAESAPQAQIVPPSTPTVQPTSTPNITDSTPAPAPN